MFNFRALLGLIIDDEYRADRSFAVYQGYKPSRNLGMDLSSLCKNVLALYGPQ